MCRGYILTFGSAGGVLLRLSEEAHKHRSRAAAGTRPHGESDPPPPPFREGVNHNAVVEGVSDRSVALASLPVRQPVLVVWPTDVLPHAVGGL
jgi:hypothetical protein